MKEFVLVVAVFLTGCLVGYRYNMNQDANNQEFIDVIKGYKTTLESCLAGWDGTLKLLEETRDTLNKTLE